MKSNKITTITKFIAAFQMRDNMKSNKITIKELLESFSLKLELSENILNYKVLNNDYFYEKIKENKGKVPNRAVCERLLQPRMGRGKGI